MSTYSSDEFDANAMDYSAAIQQLQGGRNPVLLSLTSDDDIFSDSH